MEYLAINNVYCFQKKKYKIINDKGAPILNLILINKLIIIILIALSESFLLLFQEFEEVFEPLNPNLVKFNKYSFSDNIKHSNNQIRFRKIKEKNNKFDISSKITFNVTKIRFSKEIKNNIMKVEYLIDFYEQNKNLIIPSDLTLYYDYHVFCYNKNIKTNTFITSLANIYENKHYYCTEFFNKNDYIKFGIKIYTIANGIEYYFKEFFSYKKKIYDNYIYNIINVFNDSLINEEFNKLVEKMHNNKLNNTLRLKESYIQKPIFLTKNNIGKKNEWLFCNIYNHYFCFCKGRKCLFYDVPQKCKFYFYLNIIDNNKHLYNKTDYLFGDFFYNKFSSDDIYPIFSKMMNQNFRVHYMTQKENIYEKYCQNKNTCLIFLFNIGYYEKNNSFKYI